jgi:hypothetical protein
MTDNEIDRHFPHQVILPPVCYFGSLFRSIHASAWGCPLRTIAEARSPKPAHCPCTRSQDAGSPFHPAWSRAGRRCPIAVNRFASEDAARRPQWQGHVRPEPPVTSTRQPGPRSQSRSRPLTAAWQAPLFSSLAVSSPMISASASSPRIQTHCSQTILRRRPSKTSFSFNVSSGAAGTRHPITRKAPNSLCAGD